jgi:hypothetical protein
LKRRSRKTLNLSTDRAAHALHVLITDGKIAASDVTKALKRREQMIRELQQRLDALLGVKDGPSPIKKRRQRVARMVERKAKRRMSGTRRAALKLHGKYLGHIRMLPKAAKAKVKKIRGTAGVHAAIKAARKMAKLSSPGANDQRRDVKGIQPDYQSSQQRRVAAYRQRERPKPDKHGGSGSGRQQGGSGAGRERG